MKLELVLQTHDTHTWYIHILYNDVHTWTPYDSAFGSMEMGKFMTLNSASDTKALLASNTLSDEERIYVPNDTSAIW